METIGAKFAQGDREILKRLAEFVFLRPEQLAELIGRNVYVMRRRLRRLATLGFAMKLNDPNDKWAPAAWCLREKGWARLGEEVQWEDARSNKNVPHDLEITNIHLALWRMFGDERMQWHQVGIQSEGVRPDALFAVNVNGKWRCFVLEYENTLRREQHDGEDARLHKLRQYVEYAGGRFQKEWQFENFRVLMVLPTAAKMLNLLKRMSEDEELNHPRFWMTSRDVTGNIAGEIWLTPRDYDRAAYSLVA